MSNRPVRSRTATKAVPSRSTPVPGSFTEEDLKVADLEIDSAIQRTMLKENRVVEIIHNYNPMAIGRITVSYRSNDHSNRVLDGWHRLEVTRRITDNTGTIPARVFHGLSRKEEADLFLQLNAGERPTTIDRYKVSLVAEDPEVLAIDKLLHSYGWKVSTNAGDGNLACVVALRNLYRRSVQEDQEPNLVQMALIAIGRSWGNDYGAGQSHIFTAVGRVIGEYKARLDLDRLIMRMKAYANAPVGLGQAARALATSRKMKLSMAVADLLVEEYNRGLSAKSSLHQWNKRN